jgi:hypothetical protein
LQELLEISQDSLGIAGRLVRQRTNSSDPTNSAAARTTNIVEQVFARSLQGGAMAVVLFNRAEAARNITISWRELQLPSAKYSVRNIWAHNEFGADVGEDADGYSAVVEPHEAMTLRLAPAAAEAL